MIELLKIYAMACGAGVVAVLCLYAIGVDVGRVTGLHND